MILAFLVEVFRDGPLKLNMVSSFQVKRQVFHPCFNFSVLGLFIILFSPKTGLVTKCPSYVFCFEDLGSVLLLFSLLCGNVWRKEAI